MDYDLIRSVVEEYQKSVIQSEAEVSTKLIYPLFKALGYPDECMAQEFPVYGYGGRIPLDAKRLFDVCRLYRYQPLGGVIGEEYSDPYGQGRITIN